MLIYYQIEANPMVVLRPFARAPRAARMPMTLGLRSVAVDAAPLFAARPFPSCSARPQCFAVHVEGQTRRKREQRALEPRKKKVQDYATHE